MLEQMRLICLLPRANKLSWRAKAVEQVANRGDRRLQRPSWHRPRDGSLRSSLPHCLMAFCSPAYGTRSSLPPLKGTLPPRNWPRLHVGCTPHLVAAFAHSKFDALVRCDPSVALDHRPLDFNGAVHCVDDTPELDNCAIAGALDDPAVVHGDGRIDQVASERPQPRQNLVLVSSCKPRKADHVGHKDRRELCELLAHRANAEA